MGHCKANSSYRIIGLGNCPQPTHTISKGPFVTIFKQWICDRLFCQNDFFLPNPNLQQTLMPEPHGIIALYPYRRWGFQEWKIGKKSLASSYLRSNNYIYSSLFSSLESPTLRTLSGRPPNSTPPSSKYTMRSQTFFTHIGGSQTELRRLNCLSQQ